MIISTGAPPQGPRQWSPRDHCNTFPAGRAPSREKSEKPIGGICFSFVFHQYISISMGFYYLKSRIVVLVNITSQLYKICAILPLNLLLCPSVKNKFHALNRKIDHSPKTEYCQKYFNLKNKIHLSFIKNLHFNSFYRSFSFRVTSFLFPQRRTKIGEFVFRFSTAV